MRNLIWKMVAVLALTAGAGVQAQTWPDRPLKLVVGIGAGSSTDAISRLIARQLADRLGQPVVVDNRAGAGGTVAAEMVAKAPADGYTLLSATSSIPIFPHMYTLRFDPEKDLVPVGGIGAGTMVLVVKAESGARSVAELVEKAKTRPKAVSYATAGVGSNAHLAAEVVAQLAGVEFLHVPYKSSAAGMIDVQAGLIDFTFDALSTVQPQINAKRVKALAVTTSQRSVFMPEVPTLDEAGVRGFAHPVWYAVFAPSGTPKAALDRLTAEMQTVVGSPAFREEIAKFGLEAFPVSGEALAQQIHEESVGWGRKIKTIKLDAR